MSGPTSIRNDSLDQAALLRVLNPIILDLRLEIATLRSQLPVVLPPIEFTTPATVANMFPFRVRGPDFAPRSIVVAKLENFTAPQTAATTTPGIHWDFAESGFIKILFIFGLAVNSHYRLYLEAFHG